MRHVCPLGGTDHAALVWSLLAFAMWTIAVLALSVGVQRWSLILTGRAELKSFPGDEPHGSPFYRRAVRAHANCVENLPVFAAIVIAAEAAGIDTPIFGALAVVIPAARVVQTSVHLASGSNTAVGVRFTFFSIQLIAFAVMGALIAIRAAGA
jgi:uncharacterized membrane protein YecN with MAPEG domain